MSNPKQLIQLTACTGIALIFWALASKIPVSVSLSPISGLHVKAEGSHK